MKMRIVSSFWWNQLDFITDAMKVTNIPYKIDTPSGIAHKGFNLLVDETMSDSVQDFLWRVEGSIFSECSMQRGGVQSQFVSFY